MSRTHDTIISNFDLDRLEAELAAVTGERDKAVNNYETAVLREHRMQEQRDRLASALREIAEGSPCSECGGGYAMWLAAEALAAVKGGQP